MTCNTSLDKVYIEVAAINIQYKLIFEEGEDILRHPRTMEDLHQKMNNLKFEAYNKKKKDETIYRIQDLEEKKKKSKSSSCQIILNCKAR